MIEVQNLTKQYGEITAVNGISFRVERGEILGLLGPNGAGKSTTMKILTGFLPATSGQALVAGHNVATESLQARRHIGYMPENTPLYPNMTVRRYLTFMASLKGVTARERSRAVAAAMESTGTTHVANRLIKHLSKGYRQRVGLAQAIVSDPDILILDEPTIGLDPTQIIEIRHLISAMAQRRTVILSSHILPEVSEVCERVVIINRGQVVASETTKGLARQLQKTQQVLIEARGDRAAIEKVLREAAPVRAVTFERGGTAEGSHRFRVDSGSEHDLRAELARAVVGAGHDLLHLEEHTLSLEEIFVQLIRTESKREAA